MGLFPSSHFCEVVSFHQKYRVFILMQVAPPIICQVFCCISMLSIVSDMVYWFLFLSLWNGRDYNERVNYPAGCDINKCEESHVFLLPGIGRTEDTGRPFLFRIFVFLKIIELWNKSPPPFLLIVICTDSIFDLYLSFWAFLLTFFRFRGVTTVAE